MALSDLFRPKWKHSDPNVRREAIGKVTDQGVLRKVVYSDDDKSIQLAAIEYITDEQLLDGIAGHHENLDVCKAAIKKISNKNDLLDLAKRGGIGHFMDLSEVYDGEERIVVALAAIEKINDQNALDSILKADPHKDVAIAVVKKLKALAKAEQASLESSEKFVLQGVAVPMITDKNLFSQIVQRQDRPIGLLVQMDDFSLTYGELRNSVPHPEMGGFNPFHVSAEKGPCRLLCFGCEMLLPDSFIFRLPEGAGAAFGAKPVRECPECGSEEAVILFHPNNDQ